MKQLVSVVIPIYNSAKYLRGTLDSVLVQTYSDLEIVLVDDGSTDDSGQICDEIASGDSRVKVIHKSNGGRSHARNIGVKAATGDYILFVDSDDCIKKDMVEYLVNGIQQYHTDIAICGYYRVKKSGKTKVVAVDEDVILNREQALYEICENKRIKSYLWNQLIRRELLTNIEFPIGKNFEDLMTIYRWFENINSLVLLKEAKYFYYERENSISTVKSVKANFERVYASFYRRNDLVLREEKLRYVLNYQCFMMYRKLVKDVVPKQDLNEEFEWIKSQFDVVYGELVNSDKINRIEKKEMYLLSRYNGGIAWRLMSLEVIRILKRVCRL